MSPGGTGLREVPVARRLLLAHPGRLAGSLAGIGLALALVLLITGLSAGIDERITVYEREAGAALYVAQPGTRGLLGGTSSIPTSTLDTVRATPGVDWATPVRGFFTVTDAGDRRLPAYVVGTDPGAPGGAWSLDVGHLPTGDAEVVIGALLADATGVGVGGTIDLLGRPFEVVGVAGDADMFMASFAFVTHGATDLLLGAPDTTSFVLVGTEDPSSVRGALRRQGLHALDVEEVRAHDLALKGQAYDTALNLFVLVGLLAAGAVIGLTVYGVVVEQRRAFGVLKAMGADSRRLSRLVVSQALALAGAGAIAGAVCFVVGRTVISTLRPQFAIHLDAAPALRVLALTVVVALLAAIAPARRLRDLEPAGAFGGR